MSYRYVGAMSNASVGLVNIDPSCLAGKCLLIQWIRVRDRRVGPVVIIPNKIVSASNLEPGTKTSAECRVRVVDARINTRTVNNEPCEYMWSGAVENRITFQS
jgi:hypothetical protein